MAPHLERPHPHLPHFLVLSHPLLRTLDFGTSCPLSWPRTCPQSLGVRGGKKGKLRVGRRARNSPRALLRDWRQKGACRKPQRPGPSAAGFPRAEAPRPQNEEPPQKSLLRKIGTGRLVNSGHQEAESARARKAHQTPLSPTDPPCLHRNAFLKPLPGLQPRGRHCVPFSAASEPRVPRPPPLVPEAPRAPGGGPRFVRIAACASSRSQHARTGRRQVGFQSCAR